MFLALSASASLPLCVVFYRAQATYDLNSQVGDITSKFNGVLGVMGEEDIRERAGDSNTTQ
jgi:hypothetical protein